MRDKMILAAMVSMVVGLGGCRKPPTKQPHQVVAQSSGGGNRGDEPASSGPAGTNQVPPRSSTHPQSDWGAGGTGPSGAGGERKAPEGSGNSGASKSGSSGASGAGDQGKGQGSKEQPGGGGSSGGEGGSSGSAPR